MIEALYGIEFFSNQFSEGYGVVVLETGRIFGGDSSFVYVGSYTINNGKITASVRCTNDRKTLQTVFNGLDDYTLILSGQLDEQYQEFSLQGYIKDRPLKTISIKLTRRAELP